ncbi:hypothetical protein GF351_02850, partial [Candidatus Woesearchaeota archaeon]|nr:hypothetical protein [Candidatus Woesearchaeota archaeon]
MGENILIIKLGAIGDVLRTTSVLQGIRQRYPESSISWITKQDASELLKNNQLIDNILTIEEDTDKLKKNYDIIINLDEDEKACLLASKLNGKIIGYFWHEGKVKPTKTAEEWHRMSALGPKPQNDILKKQNKKTYQQHMLQILGINTDRYE